MRLRALDLPGLFLVEAEPLADERGFFARSFCADAFAAQGLKAAFAQSSVSFNHRRGTIRGMHFQAEPNAETKLVRCTRGAVRDVVIDLRPASPTRGRWVGVDLDADNHAALYVPVGFAHGFQTLRDDTEVLYMIDPAFTPGLGRGVRWDDPAFAVVWPEPVTMISERDRTYPDWTWP